MADDKDHGHGVDVLDSDREAVVEFELPPGKSDEAAEAGSAATTCVLAMGSRQAKKVPQDAAALAFDETTRSRAWVVADGASISRAKPEEVRRFARRVAARLARGLVNRAMDLRGARREQFGAVVGQTTFIDGDTGAACVAGGLFWTGAERLWLFAIGNVTVLAVLNIASEGGAGKGIALFGDTTGLLLQGHPFPVSRLQTAARLIRGPCRIHAAIASDGAPLAGIRNHPDLQIALAGCLKDPDYVEDLLLSDNPADDATTVLVNFHG